MYKNRKWTLGELITTLKRSLEFGMGLAFIAVIRGITSNEPWWYRGISALIYVCVGGHFAVTWWRLRKPVTVTIPYGDVASVMGESSRDVS